jgi:aspartyl-tRNA(Asn)/glutamyl-tRNA(Gln) amidotransferase subunit C
MLSKDDIKKLAELARIRVDEKDAEALAGQIGSILGYVGQIKEVSGGVVGDEVQFGTSVNALRDDTNENPGGTHTEALLREAPQTQDGYVKVKKIL